MANQNYDGNKVLPESRTNKIRRNGLKKLEGSMFWAAIQVLTHLRRLSLMAFRPLKRFKWKILKILTIRVF